VSWLLWPIDTIDVHCRKLCLGVLVGVGHGGNARQTALFIRRGNRWRRSSRRLFHHDFNRHRGNRNRLGPLEEPEQQNQSNDDMSGNRQSIGHAADVGFLQKEILRPLHHSHRVNRNCLNLGLFYLRHAFGFNAFPVTLMCSHRQRPGLSPLQRCRLMAHFGSAAVVATCPLLKDEQTSAHGHQTASRRRYRRGDLLASASVLAPRPASLTAPCLAA
jgi:hypothetical protein